MDKTKEYTQDRQVLQSQTQEIGTEANIKVITLH